MSINIFKKKSKDEPVKPNSQKVLIFLILAILAAVVAIGVTEVYDYIKQKPTITSIITSIMTPNKIRFSMSTEDDGYIHIWEPRIDSKAPKKGWLVAENPFYRININLDHSYYLIFDKVRDKDILVYSDKVESEIDMLTGCDLGFGDHEGENPTQYITTALHDTDGIEYEIEYVDRSKGFVLIDTKGWDTTFWKDAERRYDVEAEVTFGVFANKPYFINAVEFSNLQKMSYVNQNLIKDPDEIVQSWVIIDEYKYACMKGGDNANADWEPPIWYNITSISTERKPWHTGSASFSKMHPRHILLGNKFGGGIIFSLPEGIFRFDDSLGVYGDQIPGVFIIYVEKPQKAIAFTVNPVNELLFFYDNVEFNTVPGYKDLMKRTCEKYGLEYPNGTLDAHNWKTKRYAYVITLTDQWYDVNANQVSDEIWTLADQGLDYFYFYNERISKMMEDTSPLSC